jgi:hypothetical protein
MSWELESFQDLLVTFFLPHLTVNRYGPTFYRPPAAAQMTELAHIRATTSAMMDLKR